MTGSVLHPMQAAVLLAAFAALHQPLAVFAADDSRKDKKNSSSSFVVDRGVTMAGTKQGKSYDPRLERSRYLRMVRSQNWPFRWEADPAKPITNIEIKLEEQRIYFYQGNVLVGEGPVSTGRPGYDTPPGSYKVLVKERKHYSNLYGELVDGKGRVVSTSAEAGDPIPKGCSYRPSPMPYFLRLTHTGIGMHEGFVTGSVASHGCIRVPRNLAPIVYEAVPVGTPVKIIPPESQTMATTATVPNSIPAPGRYQP